ncbi:hypothetical protein OC846_004682 [Tilletia horrida]|uniref:RRM domain-containing protein n=1 Tax=Tilletia horrida TaxID=155126 RepID=A0AAN6GM59_9BASI|nr:hypothetical protein OC846_004682 [Tilletia horrida]KAK0554648.1 hypothetical protein OC845_000680 [Tilletia horrida]KAK0563260.1 hypothetical protein OC861_004900 [Tilletia horrida]
MAGPGDDDDLYADLYGDTSQDVSAGPPPSATQRGPPPSKSTAAASTAASDSRSSFIPAAASTVNASAGGGGSNSPSANRTSSNNHNSVQSSGHVGANWAAHHSSTNAVQPSTFQSRMLSSSNFRSDSDQNQAGNGGNGAYNGGGGSNAESESGGRYGGSGSGSYSNWGNDSNGGNNGGHRGKARDDDSEGQSTKMFVGGLNWDTTDESLRTYMSQFGKVTHCSVMRDQATGRSRGFGFLTFDDPKAVNAVMVKEHYLDGKLIDPKRAIPRPDQVKIAKIFVGGISPVTTSESFKRFFSQYGEVLDVTLMMDKDTGRPRGYGFVTFADEKTVGVVMSQNQLVMDGKSVDIRRAHQRGQENQQGQQGGGAGGQRRGGSGQTYESGRTNNDSSGGFGVQMSGSSGAGAMNMGMGMMNPMMMNPMMGMGMGMGGGGFDPQAMAQLYQNMGWGGPNWNPQAAFQQMLASMGGGAYGGMAMGLAGGGGGGGRGYGGGGQYGGGHQNHRHNNNHGGGDSAARPLAGGGGGDERPGRNLLDASAAGLPPRPNNSVEAGAHHENGGAVDRDRRSSRDGYGRDRDRADYRERDSRDSRERERSPSGRRDGGYDDRRADRR